MGFFKTCWDFIRHVLPLTTNNVDFSSQQSVIIPDAAADVVFRPDAAVSADFSCQYPGFSSKGYRVCNFGYRDCWLTKDGQDPPMYNITTDYEHIWPKGITREYWLNVSDAQIAPDGYLKTTAQVINNTYPGPLIEACWGDTIIVHVTNLLKNDGTTIHWHGVRQLNTTDADGVNGVTQCPIAPSDTYTYNFTATQYGHTWYHSHYSAQYSDGVAGKLLIHGPTSGSWDESIPPIFINDWSHNSAAVDFEKELHAIIPPMQSILIDGHGHYNPLKIDPGEKWKYYQDRTIYEIGFTKRKDYVLRLINASTLSKLIFSIDNHNLTIIAADFVPVEPFMVTSIPIGIGQRYTVIVSAIPELYWPPVLDGNHWIRASTIQQPLEGNNADFCGKMSPGQPSEGLGILRYDSKSTELPSSLPQPMDTTDCSQEIFEELQPIVPWMIDPKSANNVTNDTFRAGIDDTKKYHDYYRWDLMPTPLWVNFSDPTILNTDKTLWEDEKCIVSEPYMGEWIFLIIAGDDEHSDVQKRYRGSHPIHMHGHDFAVLSRQNHSYDANTSRAEFNYHNPPRRDVVSLPIGGYLALAFKSDNPGAWLIHCHIGWHASSGLALQILERQNEIPGLVGPARMQAMEDTCKRWEVWEVKHPVVRDDSGEIAFLVGTIA